jgi:hypothetical protein
METSLISENLRKHFKCIFRVCSDAESGSTMCSALHPCECPEVTGNCSEIPELNRQLSMTYYFSFNLQDFLYASFGLFQQ